MILYLKFWFLSFKVEFLEAKDVVENVQDVLDELWKWDEHKEVYPKQRIVHLMDVIGINRFNAKCIYEI